MSEYYSIVTEPVWANAESTAINCMVLFNGNLANLGMLPFTASPTDDTPYGPEIFANCINGLYGVIGPYVPLASLPTQVTEGTQTL